MNLHDLVRGTITTVHPDESLVWYRSTGQTNLFGELTPSYAAPVTMLAQVQSEGDAALYQAQKVGENDIDRAFYVYASPDTPPAGLVRPLARGGDLFYRPAQSTWWLVTAVLEDYSHVGWCKIRATMQVDPPEGV